tara:strand:+ start:162 stop:470 length:309 start_codon:yes stop_codon:yes gene_type:complete
MDDMWKLSIGIAILVLLVTLFTEPVLILGRFIDIRQFFDLVAFPVACFFGMYLFMGEFPEKIFGEKGKKWRDFRDHSSGIMSATMIIIYVVICMVIGIYVRG